MYFYTDSVNCKKWQLHLFIPYQPIRKEISLSKRITDIWNTAYRNLKTIFVFCSSHFPPHLRSYQNSGNCNHHLKDTFGQMQSAKRGRNYFIFLFLSFMKRDTCRISILITPGTFEVFKLITGFIIPQSETIKVYRLSFSRQLAIVLFKEREVIFPTFCRLIVTNSQAWQGT